MFEIPTILTFSLAAYILIVIPGPAVLYVIARSIHQGRAAGIMSVLGVSVGAFVHTIAAALGISAILATSAAAFSIIKYLGAFYLIYLGLRTLLQPSPQQAITIDRDSLSRIFIQGFIVNVLNPKTALFFLAFLPQFADPTRGPMWLQLTVLGLIFVVIALLSDGLYALLAGQVGHWLRDNAALSRWQRRFSGTTYIVLGVAAAVSGGDSGK